MAQAYYHLVQAAEWQEAKQSGEPYVPRTYESDGFTHLCADAESLVDIGNHFYRETPGDWLVLRIDPAKLSAAVKLERAAQVGDKEAHTADEDKLFPHLYGPLNLDAVVEEAAMDRTSSGKFLGILWGVAVIHSRSDWLKLQS